MPFAALKTALRGQKNKDQNKDTKDVPLPGVPGIVPKERFSDCTQQIAHIWVFRCEAWQVSDQRRSMSAVGFSLRKTPCNTAVTTERSRLVPQCDRRAFALFVGT